MSSTITTISPTIGGSKRKMIRYAIVSTIASPSNLGLYGLLLHLTSWPPAISNVVAALIVVGPTFIANRLWVWEVHMSAGWHKDVPPFVAFTLLGISCSACTALIGSRHGASERTLLLITLATYTAIWALRYLFLDRFLFGKPSQPD